jgi:hypothetical protein
MKFPCTSEQGINWRVTGNIFRRSRDFTGSLFCARRVAIAWQLGSRYTYFRKARPAPPFNGDCSRAAALHEIHFEGGRRA